MRNKLARVLTASIALLFSWVTVAAELEEITVTARKREEPIQDVPISITAFDSAQIDRIGMDDFHDYQRLVPGLASFDRGPGDRDFFFRGITTSVGSPLVQIYIDDVPQTGSNPAAVQVRDADPRLYDVERIEVLRGPQNTLFGSGAMGGAIRIITNKPNTSDFAANAELTGSNTHEGGQSFDANVMLNLPLVTDQLALRAVVMYRNDAGYIDVLPKGVPPPSSGIPQPGAGLWNYGTPNANSEDVRGARVSALYKVTDRFNVTGSVYWQTDKQATLGVVDKPWTALQVTSAILEPRQDQFTQYNLTADYDFDFASLVSSTSYINREVDQIQDLGFLGTAIFGSTVPIVSYRRVPFNTVSEELRLTSRGESRFAYTVGAYAEKLTGDENQTLLAPGFSAQTGIPTPNDTLFDKNINYFAKQYSFFGQVSFELVHGLSIELGERYFNYKIGYDNYSDGLFNGGFSYHNVNLSESGSTPKVGLDFKPSKDLLFFADATKGFRIGQPHPFIPASCDAELATIGYPNGPPTLIKSDSLWQYELGAKTAWLDHRLIANATAYYIDWKNIPQQEQLFSCGFQITVNIGKATSRGFEFELTATPTDRIQLNMSVGHTDATLAADAPTVGGHSGDQLQDVPKWTGSAGAQYSFHIGDGSSGYLRADYSYTGWSYDTFQFTPEWYRPSYNILNVRLGVIKDSWESVLFVENATDARAVVAARQFENQKFIGRPLTFGLTVRKSWGGKRS
jgi:outer membrane receptor protein involved in Fe transport